MNAIAVSRPERPAELIRWLVRAGLMSALVFALYVVLAQFDASKECRAGSFSADFSGDFDVRPCDLVVRRFGHEIRRFRLT
jgi:hypothetical protein